MSISASPLPPTLTNATFEPNPTMVPSIVCPRLNCRALTDASNIEAKSSSWSLIATHFIVWGFCGDHLERVEIAES
jgi:hypothetical protein